MAESGQSRGLNRDSRASRSHCARSLSLTRAGTWRLKTTYKSPRPPPPCGSPWPRTRSFCPFCPPAATFAGHVAAKGNRADRAIQCLFQCHHDVGFDVLPALGMVAIAETGAASSAAHRAEELLEKIAKTRAAEVKLGIDERLFLC